MKLVRLVPVVLALSLVLVPLHAQAAAVTWAAAGSNGVVGTCAAATMDAPTLATQGLVLNSAASGSVHNIVVSYESTSGNLTATTGKLLAYWYNPNSDRENKWERAQALDLTVGEAADSATWQGITITSPIPSSRIAWVPSAIGQAGKVYIQGSR